MLIQIHLIHATTLDYDIAVDSNVSITVYDISQVVEVLVDDYKFAGEYSITWNAQNYSSGVYFIGGNQMVSILLKN